MDFTQMAELMDCPERYRLRYVEQLKKRSEDYRDYPREFGIGIHCGLEAYYNGEPMAAILEAFTRSYQVTVPLDENILTMANGIQLLKEYPDWAKKNDGDIKVLSTEEYIRVKFDNSDEEWECKTDLIYENASGIWVRDHKSTKSNWGLSPLWWKKFDLSPQLSGAAFAVAKKYGQCSGVEISGIKMGFRTRNSKLGGPGFWWNAKKNIYNKNPEQLRDFQQNAQRWIARKRELETTQPPSQWPKNETQCLFCDYREICLTVQDPQIKELNYEKFDPYAYLSGKSKLNV